MEKIFTKGLYADKPAEKAPDFIKARLSVLVKDFIPFIEEYKNVAGYVNIDIKESRGGKYYAELNTYKKVENEVEETLTPEEKEQVRQAKESAVKAEREFADISSSSDDVPF